MAIHVVSKSDNRQHATFQIPDPTEPLQPSSVRIRASLLGLTSNNLTYASGGTRLHWWDAYPVPATAPTPYNNISQWGIVPAWGLATVLESTIPEIPPGTTFFGFWPTSSHAVDLQLTPAEPSGHWTEISPHRQNLMSLYNRYITFDTKGKEISEFAWDASVRPIWVAGYVLAEYIFTPDPDNHPPIHPLHESQSWSVKDSNLSNAVFVSLAASTKTARSTAYNFFCRPPNAGPLGLLQVTSSPGAISEAAEKFIPQFPVKAVSYGDVEGAAEWIASVKPERIVIADFGARDGALGKLVEGIKGNGDLKSAKLTVLAVGNQQKVYTSNDLQASQESFVSFNKVQMNTSGVQEAALKLRDSAAYFDELQKRWDHWVQNRECAAPDLRLAWGEGVVGPKGIEGGWEALCGSNVKPEEALVYRL
ncbi:hypothetical protein BDV12DRAFT_178044 [Aspergillus spectabilis]